MAEPMIVPPITRVLGTAPPPIAPIPSSTQPISVSAIMSLQKYTTDGKTYDITQALKDKVSPDTLKSAGFTQAQVDQAQAFISAPLSQLTPTEKAFGATGYDTELQAATYPVVVKQEQVSFEQGILKYMPPQTQEKFANYRTSILAATTSADRIVRSNQFQEEFEPYRKFLAGVRAGEEAAELPHAITGQRVGYIATPTPTVPIAGLDPVTGKYDPRTPEAQKESGVPWLATPPGVVVESIGGIPSITQTIAGYIPPKGFALSKDVQKQVDVEVKVRTPVTTQPPAPTPDQQNKWEAEAKAKGVTNVWAYVYGQWMKENNLSTGDLARLGIKLPDILKPPTPEQNSQWESEAKSQGVDPLTYSQMKWLMSQGLSAQDIANLGQILPGVTMPTPTKRIVPAPMTAEQLAAVKAVTKQSDVTLSGSQAQIQAFKDALPLLDKFRDKDGRYDIDAAVDAAKKDLTLQSALSTVFSVDAIKQAEARLSKNIKLTDPNGKVVYLPLEGGKDTQGKEYIGWNDIPSEYQHIGLTQGYNAMIAAIQSDKAVLAATLTQQKNALDSIPSRYKTDKGGLLAGLYLADGGDSQTLQSALNDDKAFSNAQINALEIRAERNALQSVIPYEFAIPLKGVYIKPVGIPTPTQKGYDLVSYLIDHKLDTTNLETLKFDSEAISKAKNQAGDILLTIDYLNRNTPITGTRLSATEGQALERAIIEVGLSFPSGSAEVTWRGMSDANRKKVATYWLQDKYKDDAFGSVAASTSLIAEKWVTEAPQAIAGAMPKLPSAPPSLVVNPANIEAQKLISSWSGNIIKSQQDFYKYVSGLATGERTAGKFASGVYDLASSIPLLGMQVLGIGLEKNLPQSIAKASQLGIGIVTLPMALPIRIAEDPWGGSAYVGALVATMFLHPVAIAKSIGKSLVRLEPTELSPDILAFQADVGRTDFYAGMSPVRGRALIEAIELVHLGKESEVALPGGGKVAKVGHDVVVYDISGEAVGHVTALQRYVPDVVYSATDYPQSFIEGAQKGEFVPGKTGVASLSASDLEAMHARGDVLFTSPQVAAAFGEKANVAIRITPEDIKDVPQFIQDIKGEAARRDAFYKWARSPESEAGIYPLQKGYWHGDKWVAEYELMVVKLSLKPIEPNWYSSPSLKFPNPVPKRVDISGADLLRQGVNRTNIVEPTTGRMMSERVTVLPVNSKGEFVFVRSRSSGLPDDVWESVGGGVDLQKSPTYESNALREVGEEIGIKGNENDLNPLGFYQGKVNQYAISGTRVYIQDIGNQIPKLGDYKENLGLKVWDGKSDITVTAPVYDLLKAYNELYPNKIDISKVKSYDDPIWAKARDTEYLDRVKKDRYGVDVLAANRNEIQYLDQLKQKSIEETEVLNRLGLTVDNKLARMYTTHPVTGEPTPVLWFATEKALAEGKGLPPLTAKYKAEAYQQFVQPVRELFHKGIRPIEVKVVGEGEAVSPIASKFSAVELKIADAKMQDFVKAKTNVPPRTEMLTMLEREKAGSRVILGLKDVPSPQVRQFNWNDFEHLDNRLAPVLDKWVKVSDDARGYGSLASWLFNPKAPRPGDFDVTVRDPISALNKLQPEIDKAIPKSDYRVRTSDDGWSLDVKDAKGDWQTNMDVRSYKRHYEGMWGKESYSVPKGEDVDIGIMKVESLGDQITRRGTTLIKKSGILDELPEIERAKDIPRFQSDAEYLIDKSNLSAIEKQALRDDLYQFLGDYAQRYASALRQQISQSVASQAPNIRQQAYTNAKARFAKGEPLENAYLDEFAKLSEKPFVITIGRLLYPQLASGLSDEEVFDKLAKDPSISEIFKYLSEKPILPKEVDKVILDEMAKDLRLENIYTIEPKPTEAKPLEVKPSELKPTEVRPTEIKPSEVRPYEPMPVEPKPYEIKPIEPKPYEPTPYEPVYPKPHEPIPPPPPPREAQKFMSPDKVPKRFLSPGTIQWRQGKKWIAIPPPYRTGDMQYFDYPLPGHTRFATGKGSAAKTIEVLGGVTTKNVDVDMGWAQIHIDAGKKIPDISFAGGKKAAETRWAMEAEAQQAEIGTTTPVPTYQPTSTTEPTVTKAGTEGTYQTLLPPKDPMIAEQERLLQASEALITPEEKLIKEPKKEEEPVVSGLGLASASAGTKAPATSNEYLVQESEFLVPGATRPTFGDSSNVQTPMAVEQKPLQIKPKLSLDKEKFDEYDTGKVKVYFVNPEFVRDTYDSDFDQGGNHARYNWIPDNEVWLDANLGDNEVPYVLFHELHEIRLRQGGMDYNTAHDKTKELEDEARHNGTPEYIEALIDKELSYLQPQKVEGLPRVKPQSMQEELIEKETTRLHRLAERRKIRRQLQEEMIEPEEEIDLESFKGNGRRRPRIESYPYLKPTIYRGRVVGHPEIGVNL